MIIVLTYEVIRLKVISAGQVDSEVWLNEIN